MPIEIVFKRVGTRVSAATSGRQEPWIALSLRGDFYFVAGSNTSAEQPVSVSTSPPTTSGKPPSVSAPSGGSGMSAQDANVIATKDIGSLRVVLKSVMTVKFMDDGGNRVNGVRCSFEFMNRETLRPIAVALHAWPFGSIDDGYAHIGWPGDYPGNVLRSTLLDERGTVWSLSPSGVTGIGIVSAGRRDSGGLFGPTDILSLLQRQDETGTNMSSSVPSRAFVFGSTTSIPLGQIVTIIMNFAQDRQAYSMQPPKFFQIVSEIVVGAVTEGSKKSYTLQSLIFDRVSMTAGG